METHVCENVHTEFILSSCYSFPTPTPTPPSSLGVGAFRGCVSHLTTPSELDWLKRFPVNVPPLRRSFWYREETAHLPPAVENSDWLFVMFITGKGFQTPRLLNRRTAPTCRNLRNLQRKFRFINPVRSKGSRVVAHWWSADPHLHVMAVYTQMVLWSTLRDWEVLLLCSKDTKLRWSSNIQTSETWINFYNHFKFTRSKVEGVHADHMRGLAVYEFEHGQGSSVAGQLQDKDPRFMISLKTGLLLLKCNKQR